ncbi:uncharacterized protein CEXT_210141 [Caerostris extrusa]|uniref:Uncharacterized protein n=1 Tax=Caerostris extrusa TaxID=172846 RepID=A0AAV4X786_CAEEX|nr:uncharacterized protein CEXT_210141 [Caerostris extrusa]
MKGRVCCCRERRGRRSMTNFRPSFQTEESKRRESVKREFEKRERVNSKWVTTSRVFFFFLSPPSLLPASFHKTDDIISAWPLGEYSFDEKIGRDAVEKAGRASTKDVIEARFTAGYPPDGLFNFTPQCHLRGAHRASPDSITSRRSSFKPNFGRPYITKRN